ncbi:MAG: hypothetical protein HYT40_04180, partial [Candidatus Sungbacteria bacterium]|nr:hypothetical protein [Candidatus Sungbacteria bacterium]
MTKERKEWGVDPRDIAYEQELRKEDFDKDMLEKMRRWDLSVDNIKVHLEDMDPAKLTKIKDWLE